MAEQRHLALLRLTPDMIRQLVDVPEGHTVRNVFADPMTDSICVMVEGPSFDPVAEGMRPADVGAFTYFVKKGEHHGVLEWSFTWAGSVPSSETAGRADDQVAGER